MTKSPRTLELEQRRYWDACEASFSTEVHVSQLVDRMPDLKNAKILDYGCGYGRTMLELKARGYEESNLFGIDISEKMVLKAERNLPYAGDILVKKAQRHKLPFETAKFDAVLLVGVLCYCVPNVEQVRLVDEIKRILKPSGTLYINDYLLNLEDEANLARYNDFREVYSGEKYDYPYGVFDTMEGILCRHHDMEWVEQLLADFKVTSLAAAQDNTQELIPTHGVTAKPLQLICTLNLPPSVDQLPPLKEP